MADKNMADKKSDLDSLLSAAPARPPIRRGQGMRLSHEEQSSMEESHNRTIAQSHNRTIAQSPTTSKRVNRGYMLREDVIKACKRLALEEDRALYEVMEEALVEYLERRGVQTAAAHQPERTPE